jgi:DNA polymerase-3 subunit alpha
MNPADFVHVHTHSYYSLLDGLASPEQLLNHAKKLGMNALALTDHGVMYGAVEFYKAAKQVGIKPILGCEVYVALDSRHDRRPTVDQRQYHLVLLAENNTGYHNLVQLVTKAGLEGYYYKPRVDHELLAQYSEGLIACSACVAGEIPRIIVERGYEQAVKRVREYVKIFGEDHFYLELQHHPDIKDQEKVNRELVRISEKLGVPLVVSNDVHYRTREDASAQDTLICIQTQKELDEQDRLSMLDGDYSMIPPEQMMEQFAEFPEALENTARIAQRCNVELELGETIFPHFDTPDGKTPRSVLRELCEAGIEQRYGIVRSSEGWTLQEGTESEDISDLPKPVQEIGERLEYELSVIERMGFETYFLIVWDFVKYAKDHRIVVGPGRGSAAGSLVSYVLQITDIDPMQYDLLFERFLNPDRLDEPDIDTDFDDEHRDQMIEYVREKYGPENVAQVITFGTMAAKAAVKDVGRVMGIPYEQVDRVAQLIPSRPGVKLEEVLKEVPEFARLVEEDETARRIVDMAIKLEGVVRHASVHACAVVMAKDPLTRYTPLQNAPRGNKVVISQYGAKSLKALGLLKMDFLGLRNLTVIRHCMELIRETEGAEPDIYPPPLDDKETFDLFSRGDTTAVFQFESSGMKKYLVELKPSTLEDIIAMVALYRPGPMQFIDEFIARRHGRREVKYDHPLMEQALKNTYGIAVYQEQVMQMSRNLAGFTGGEADTLRSAMSKKNVSLMHEMGEKFLKGAEEQGVPPRTAEKIWSDWQAFGGYAFNKSHAASYAFVAYQTAYLKAHYPKEFMAANLTSVMDNNDRVAVLTEECRRMGIKVLSPDVNESQVVFAVVEDGIRFGLGAVKNVGAGAIQSIIEAREEDPFTSLFDFCERVDLKALNKRMVESLILAGAMDSLEGHRAQLLQAVDACIGRGQSIQSDRERGQTSLFDLLSPQSEAETKAAFPRSKLPDVSPWSQGKMLAQEKEMLGFYVSGHPLEQYEEELKAFATPSTELEKASGDLLVGGIVTSIKTIVDRKGKQMAFVSLEDFQGTTEMVVFSEEYGKYQALLYVDATVLVQGKRSGNGNGGSARFQAEEVLPLSEARKRYARAVNIALSSAEMKKEDPEKLKKIAKDHEGPCRLLIHVRTTEHGSLVIRAKDLTVAPSEDLLSELREMLGKKAVWLT